MGKENANDIAAEFGGIRFGDRRIDVLRRRRSDWGNTPRAVF
jgi:hypothetical protein